MFDATENRTDLAFQVSEFLKTIDCARPHLTTLEDEDEYTVELYKMIRTEVVKIVHYSQEVLDRLNDAIANQPEVTA